MSGGALLALSPVPGLPHLLLGRRKKGLALLCIFAGIVLTAALTRSYLLKALMACMYLATMAPAAVEAEAVRAGTRSRIDADAPAYVIFMLLTTGMTALPLLWQSPRFSRRAKAGWSATVVALAAAFFTLLVRFGRDLEAFLRGMVQ